MDRIYFFVMLCRKYLQIWLVFETPKWAKCDFEPADTIGTLENFSSRFQLNCKIFNKTEYFVSTFNGNILRGSSNIYVEGFFTKIFSLKKGYIIDVWHTCKCAWHCELVIAPPQKKLDINAFKLKWWIWKQLIFAIWSIFGHFLRHAMPFLSFLCHFHTWKT